MTVEQFLAGLVFNFESGIRLSGNPFSGVIVEIAGEGPDGDHHRVRAQVRRDGTLIYRVEFTLSKGKTKSGLAKTLHRLQDQTFVGFLDLSVADDHLDAVPEIEGYDRLAEKAWFREILGRELI